MSDQSLTPIILMAEDSLTMRILLQNILKSAGYRVKVAVDGQEAYEILQTEPIDLLLSDVEMPRMTGFELTEKVRNTEKWRQLPIVLCTSRGSPKDRAYGLKIGANAYIDKNQFEADELLNVIKEQLYEYEQKN